MAIQMLPIWEEVDDFLTSTPTPEQILAFRPSIAAQERVRVLLELNRAGNLTADEQLELDQYLAVETLIRRLKAKAALKLQA